MDEFVTANLAVREPADTIASAPGEMTQLFAAMLSPAAEIVADPLLSTMNLHARQNVPEAAAPGLHDAGGLHPRFDATPRVSKLAAAPPSVMVEDDTLSGLLQSLSVTDAASIRVTSPARASLPIQEPPADPSMATTAPRMAVDKSFASETETQPLKRRVSPDSAATTQEILVAGIADSGIASPSEPKSAASSILQRQSSIARMFATSDSEPRTWERHEPTEALTPVASQPPNTAESVSKHSVPAPKFSANADGMTELLRTLDGSAASPATPSEPEPPPEAPGEFTRIVRASRSREESLRATPQSPPPVVAELQPAVAPAPLASKYVPMLLLAIVILLVANLVTMLFVMKR